MKPIVVRREGTHSCLGALSHSKSVYFKLFVNYLYDSNTVKVIKYSYSAYKWRVSSGTASPLYPRTHISPHKRKLKGWASAQGLRQSGFCSCSLHCPLCAISVQTSKHTIKILSRDRQRVRHKWKPSQWLLVQRTEGEGVRVDMLDLCHPSKKQHRKCVRPQAHFQVQIFFPSLSTAGPIMLSNPSSYTALANKQHVLNTMYRGQLWTVPGLAHQNCMDHSHSCYRCHLIELNPGEQAFKNKIFTATSNRSPGHLYRHTNRAPLFTP